MGMSERGGALHSRFATLQTCMTQFPVAQIMSVAGYNSGRDNWQGVNEPTKSLRLHASEGEL